jgi:MYXO-CTERM domain-containing protein
MWHSYNDNTCIPSNHSGLDPIMAASAASETFHPTCALTFTVVTRGNAMFKDVFGWYNATGSPPPFSDLHPMLGCNDDAGAAATLDLTQEPSWQGGDVGFFLMTPESPAAPGTCANGNCCPTIASVQAGQGRVYFTEHAYNPDQQGGNAFLHVAAFSSLIVPSRSYFGCEDTYGGGDNDFADFVASVDGVQCSGAGVSCTTGMQGVCALGVTDCTQGQLGCQELVQPSPEQCNGVDDDCNGQVDDGATCPDPSDICHGGRCVPACGSAEFPCSAGTACDPASRLCVDPSCIGVTCAAGQICTGGQCGTPCSGIVCPHGQLCVGETCVDLCSGVTCPAGKVCTDGVCIPGCGTCGGLTCAAPLACTTASGRCEDPSCPGGCSGGQWCLAGTCVDPCDGAKCPAGQTCAGGQCQAGQGAPPDSGLATPPGSSSPPAGAGSTAGASSNDAGIGATWGSGATPHGCGCNMPGHDGPTPLPATLATLAGAIAVVRRRRRDRA